MCRRLFIIWLTSAVAGLLSLPCFAAQKAAWNTGANLASELTAPTSIAWDNATVEYALSSLSQAERIAIVRDRRVDPELLVKLAIDGKPLAEALADIAEHLQIGYCQFGPVAYFGPPQSAARLRTLAALRLEDVARLPTPARRKLLLLKSWRWNRLAEPRQLAAELAREAGVELVGLDRIPHDLWPAADLPPLSWIDRLTLVCAQFDLTYRIEDAGRRVELIPAPERPVLARTYLAPRDAAQTAAAWSKELPDAKISAAGTRIRVEAPLEDQEQVERRLKGAAARRTKVTAGPEVYQLSIENAALDKVVAQLAARLNLEFKWDDAAIGQAGIAMDQLVSVKIADADLDKLLAAVFAGTGLVPQRDGRTITIRPK